MPVYIDNARIPYRRMLMCHMVADTLPELHEMAQRLGLKRHWFQKHGIPHYDICSAKRVEALGLGVVPVTRRELGKKLLAWRKAK